MMSTDSGISRPGTSHDVASLLERRQQLTDALAAAPYDIVLYLRRAAVYAQLAYPDLAAGDAYRALLLTDELCDESFEYHGQTAEAMSVYVDHASLKDVLEHAPIRPADTEEDSAQAHDAEEEDNIETSQKLAAEAAVHCYEILSQSLLLCGCLRSAHTFCERGLAAAPSNASLQKTKGRIGEAAGKRVQRQAGGEYNPADLPDRGRVRREIYPWNTYEPDRFAPASLAFLNGQLAHAAPKCEVRATELPVLAEPDSSNTVPTTTATGTTDDPSIPTCLQLGIFAKEAIAPGEVVLREYSLLTANNRLKESTCDACSTELPRLADIGKPIADSSSSSSSRRRRRHGSDTPLVVPAPVNCPECFDTVFCDEFCFERAQDKYHPAVCDKDVDVIAKDPEDARNADDALYVLLLARLMAMAAHQERHSLDVDEIKYIWGDFVPSDVGRGELLDCDNSRPPPPPPPSWTLPFSFDVNIATPLHILEKMDIDVFADLALFDVWVCNTLYAKFRGTASARKSHRDGRPDVAAVHPLWCLANHDCDPNVMWEWGGRMVLWAREKRVTLRDGTCRPGGIAAGDEILNHYCDVDLPVQQRREWASGSLGGWCMCQRCRDEAAAENSSIAE